MNLNQFYTVQFASVTSYIVLYNVLIHPLRFSKKKTFFIVSFYFLILHLPQILFASFFYNTIDTNSMQFFINIAYWTLYIFFSYLIIVVIAKRDWLHNFFFIIVWDITSSILFTVLLPLQYFFPSLDVFLKLGSSLLSIVIIRKFLRYHIKLSPNVYKFFSIFYAILRFFLILYTLRVSNRKSEFILLGIVFSISVILLLTIFVINKFSTSYINQKCQYYQNLFSSSPFAVNGNPFFSYLQKQYHSPDIAFHFQISLPDSYFSKDHYLYYLLILCHQILWKKSKQNQLSSVYLNIQYQMNYTIISTGSIKSTANHSIRWRDEVAVSFKELLLRQLLKLLHGQVQFLDENNLHTQIQIVYSI